MKKCLLLLLFAISCTSAYAQIYERITCDSEESAQKLAETMLENARKPYILVDAEHIPSKYSYILDYVEQTDDGQDGRKIRITFRVYMIGASPALEIPGTPLYQLNSIDAPYLDVFPIWKAYFSPDANAETLSTKTSGETVQFKKPNEDKSIYKFAPNSQRSGYWILKRTI